MKGWWLVLLPFMVIVVLTPSNSSPPPSLHYSPPSSLPLLTPGGGFGFHRTAHDIFQEFFGGENPFADIFNGGGLFGGMLA